MRSMAGVLGQGAFQPFTQTFSFTGAPEIFAAPAGATQALVKMWGAGGGSSGSPQNADGGGGGYTSVTIPLAGGESVELRVGGGGRFNDYSHRAWPGGGRGRESASAGTRDQGGGGGGYSAILIDGVLQAVAGGGGGAGDDWTARGGRGGGANGGNGGNDNGNPKDHKGLGGSQTEGGWGGQTYTESGGVHTRITPVPANPAANAGGDGGYLQGGDCATANDGSGGGGGGYYGGGGSENFQGGGGGGSGYVRAGLTGATSGGGMTRWPPNNSDPDWAGAGEGGAGPNDNGNDGRIVIYWS